MFPRSWPGRRIPITEQHLAQSGCFVQIWGLTKSPSDVLSSRQGSCFHGGLSHKHLLGRQIWGDDLPDSPDLLRKGPCIVRTTRWAKRQGGHQMQNRHQMPVPNLTWLLVLQRKAENLQVSSHNMLSKMDRTWRDLRVHTSPFPPILTRVSYLWRMFCRGSINFCLPKDSNCPARKSLTRPFDFPKCIHNSPSSPLFTGCLITKITECFLNTSVQLGTQQRIIRG